jgi:hypothetical protein
MAHIRLFLYFSVLNFTRQTSCRNRLFRVSKSRNGASRGTFNLRDRAVRMGAILSRCRLGTLSVGEKNYCSRSLHYAAVTVGAFTTTLWLVPFEETRSELLIDGCLVQSFAKTRSTLVSTIREMVCNIVEPGYMRPRRGIMSLSIVIHDRAIPKTLTRPYRSFS